jgi:uncharacterized protein involved in outer membrane biogenesis
MRAKNIKRKRWFVIIVLAVIIAVILSTPIWLKPVIENRASAALGHRVHIAHLAIRPTLHPTITLQGVEIANPEGFPQNHALAAVERLSVTINLMALFHHAIMLPALEVGPFMADLQALPDGRENWALPKKSPSKSNGSPWQFNIDRLMIARGSVIHVRYPQYKSDFRIEMETRDGQGHNATLHVEAHGLYAGQPITARFDGGSVLALRDTKNPYPVMLDVVNGDTGLALKGTLLDPIHIGGANLDLTFHGKDLATLYPLTSVPLPHTAPFTLNGKFDYANRAFRFCDFSGRVGGSDLEGSFKVSPFEDRRKIVADLRSEKVVLSDLAGFVGSKPGKEEDQKQTQQQTQQDGKVLPQQPINLPKLRSADIDVRYTVKRLESERTPLDNLSAHLTVGQNSLQLQPIEFSVGSGHILAHLSMNTAQDPPQVSADINFRDLDIGHILQKTAGAEGAGTLGGQASLNSTGKSVAEWLGHGNGGLELFTTSGNFSALLVDLVGLDFGNALLAAAGVPRRADLRCMVADFVLVNGTADTHLLIADTDEANIVGQGTVNFTDEHVNYSIRSIPKRPSFGSLGAPIDITGTLKDPTIAPKTSSLIARGGAATILGTLATPLAALIPTLQFGQGENHNCNGLLQAVQAAGRAASERTPGEDAPPE